MSRWKLVVRNTAGELLERLPGEESALRAQATTMATVHGQKSWRFDLYDGGTLKATYKRGVWNEHSKETA
jgi:hypothetical protein